MTIEKIWDEILKNHDVRQNLSQLRKELKENVSKSVLLHYIGGEEDRLIGLLGHDDAKTRKNTALLLGELGSPEFLKPLYQAYEIEKQLFVKSAYLTAMKNFDYTEYVDDFKARLEGLSKAEMTVESEKHITEEIRVLSSLVVAMEGIERHTFRGFEENYNVILLTNRNYPEMTREALKKALPKAEMSVFSAGVMAKVENLNWTEDIRTYQELLFAVEGMQSCVMGPNRAAETIVNSQLIPFLEKAHQGEAPFYFRIELRSDMPLNRRSSFVKKLSAQIEKLSERKLINTPSHYEFEIRIIETKDEKCNCLVKCYTLRDTRFAYREGVIPTSIKPVNAAVLIELTKSYMKKDAQVLDPFCGVGTLLIERHKAMDVKVAYGIDIQPDAIEKARKNTELANQTIHYINRDFFDFKHDYLFDEVVTDMPFAMGQKSDEDIYALYLDFFATVIEVLKEKARMILYTHNKEYVKEMAEDHGFKILKTYEISRREKTEVMVLERI